MSVDSLLIHFAKNHPSDIAAKMVGQPVTGVVEVLESLPVDVACKVTSRLASRLLVAVLKNISGDVLANMLLVGQSTDVVAIASHMNDETQQRVLSVSAEPNQERLKRMFYSSLKTLSGITSPDFFRVELDDICNDVHAQLIESGVSEEQPVFVVNKFGVYQGIAMPMLLLQKKNASSPVASVLEKVDPLSGVSPIAVAINAPQWAKFRVLPVVDSELNLLGALTFERLIRARNGLTESGVGLDVLVGEVATAYIGVCANLMEFTFGEKKSGIN